MQWRQLYPLLSARYSLFTPGNAFCYYLRATKADRYRNMIRKRYEINNCVSFFKHNIDVYMCDFLYVSDVFRLHDTTIPITAMWSFS